jgi:predicted alpha/beta hydrolase
MPVDTNDPSDLVYFAKACGWAIALAHARSGVPALIAGYLGSSDAFDDAITKFAADYADQTERDYEAMVKAIKAGHIAAQPE